MTAAPEVRLLHDGELADVAGLLDRIGVEWAEGAPAAAAPLVIGTPLALLRDESAAPESQARIALCDGASRTLEHKLESDGVDLVLRRPVHPAALRLLVLHLIYRGPERRRLRRVGAAIPVRYRLGWRRGRALLLEFSVAGCSLLLDRAPSAGQRIHLVLPAELGLGRTLRLKGRVARTEPAPAGAAREHVAAVEFGELGPDVHQRLAAAVVARFRPAASPAPSPDLAVERDLEIEERRRLPRRRYTRALHGRVDESHVVLMGANLSPRGMRIDPEPRLAVGETLKLDLYGQGDVPPLRLDARVARDDGERGLYLEFIDPWPGAPALIERLIKTLPVVARGEGEMVISEVVEADTLGDRRG